MFPEYFLFGTATSSHQIEGDNIYNDWWDWEQKGKVRHKSGKACNHWELYREDIELMAKLGFNAYRFSIEWSRIFPRKNEENPDALERYKEIVRLLREKNIEPMVTLHHFTNPRWFIEEGGWLKKDNIRYFLDYVELVVNELKDVDLWVTFNEPIVYVLMGYVWGKWPPGIKSMGKAGVVEVNIYRAHAEAVKIIREHGRKAGIVKNLVAFKPYSEKKRDMAAYKRAEHIYNWAFLDAMETGVLRLLRGVAKVPQVKIDFIGVNYYTGYIVKHSWNPFKMFMDTRPLDTGEWTTMGYCVYPKGLYEVLKKTHERYNKTIYVTENGVATEDDEFRIRAIIRHLQYLHKALNEGVDVKGYFYWSLLDNFEWAEGYTQKFGIVEVDFTTFERKPRRSAYIYGEIARCKKISDELLEKYGVKEN
ncbi:family 1 glycosylhydrolase [Desulfurococcaceae archaeon MEX13E-LK6-19]|nr:family 1 glycosylhydrolase [Desulfurococcaceae archaeon MEX13E-LK6-19]